MSDLNKYVDELGKLFGDEMHGFRPEVYRVILGVCAEAKAEALREAADRVDTLFKGWSAYQGAVAQATRAAITKEQS